MDILRDLEQQIIPANKLQSDGVPSASIALLDNGKITSHVITTGSETANTVYQACSISKAITGLAVARLIDQGLLSYETKVINHLSQTSIDAIVDDKTAHLLQHVTVGMLLSHTSGLSQHGFEGYTSTEPHPTPEDILAGLHPSNTPRVQFLTFPGAQWNYAGGGFVLLQLALEQICNKPFAQIMHDTVLKPLNMTRSWYGDLPAGETDYADAWHTGFTRCEPRHHRLVEEAAAGLWTTPTDLLRTVVAVQESLTSDSGFLTQSTAKKMLTIVTEADHPGVKHFGMGWLANDSAFVHTGDNWPGYTSYLFGFHGGVVNNATRTASPANKALSRSGFCIMVNGALGHERAIWQIMGAIFYLAKWPRFKTLSSQFAEDEWVAYPAPEGTRVDAGWEGWVGKWEEEWEVVDEDGPRIVFREFPSMRLRTAAAPVAELEGGKKELLFVVDGMPVGVRLTWQGDERVIEMRQRTEKTLKRKT